MYSNRQILAAVVAEWARPAISQIAVSRFAQMTAVQQIEQGIIGTGLVGSGYKLAGEIAPFVEGGVNILLQPALERMLESVPDEAIPALAKNVVETAMQQPKFTVLEGLVEFEREDMEELRVLLEKNLPVAASEGYEVKR